MGIKIVYGLAVFFGVTMTLLLSLRFYDGRAEKKEWSRLTETQPKNPAAFEHAMIAHLPEPAQRYFKYSIATGTPLWTVVEIEMQGEFSLGTKEAPNYQEMEAKQILASPFGFVWQLHLPGPVPISGSDSGEWTRFQVLGVVPVARAGGDADHQQSAFARHVVESVIWSPASVLPGTGIAWQGVDANTASVTVIHESLTQTVNITVDARGQPIEVSLSRWSNANADKEYRFQPFGGKLSDFREVNGYRLPFRVEAGNLFNTEEYFSFFKAEVSQLSFPARQ